MVGLMHGWADRTGWVTSGAQYVWVNRWSRWRVLECLARLCRSRGFSSPSDLDTGESINASCISEDAVFPFPSTGLADSKREARRHRQASEGYPPAAMKSRLPGFLTTGQLTITPRWVGKVQF